VVGGQRIEERKRIREVRAPEKDTEACIESDELGIVTCRSI